MHSFLAYVVPWYTWLFEKGSFRSAAALRRRIAEDRASGTAASQQPPAHLRAALVVEDGSISDGLHAVYDLSAKSERAHRMRILYLHGGPLVLSMHRGQWDLAGALASRLDATVTVPVLPLGPEHDMAYMYDVLRPLHDDMAATAAREGVPLYIVGDSAGGNLALGLAQRGGGKVDGIVLITPMVDLSLDEPDSGSDDPAAGAGAGAVAVAVADPLHALPGLREVVRMLCPDVGDLRDPAVSPVYGDLACLPRMLVLVAEMDMLACQARRLVRLAADQGCGEIELLEGEGMVHSWPSLSPCLHESRLATSRMAQWLERGATPMTHTCTS